jgi:hypothetical protein
MVPVKVRNGTQRDAQLYAAGCNDKHGLRRTTEDKERAVEMLLADDEWAKTSDNWIAEKCRVTHDFVAKIRARKNSKPASENSDAKQETTETNDENSASGCDIATSTRNSDASVNGEKESAPKSQGRPSRAKRTGKDGKKYPASKKKKPKEVDADKGDAHEPPTLDKAGHKITASAQEAFANVDKFEELDSLCRKLQAGIDALARLPGGEQLAKFTQATQSGDKTIHKNEHLQRLKGDLRGTRPYSVCPYCSGKAPKNCKGCSGAGWVTKTTWDAAEESIKEKLACLS